MAYRSLLALVLLSVFINDAHPFYASKATIQAPQNVNVSQKSNPLIDKLRQLKSAFMAFFQKKMDEFRIIAAGFPSIASAVTQQQSPATTQSSSATSAGSPTQTSAG
ncbi:uncharacterized protein LOC124361882 isoform X3 [Homalodisca vitripennis]|uniref:uncharacterized protein LOC124361882 isoform X3 n=1 Tax=Homalodisca vitripennis TaxID=197043 RepID=UPI001EEC75BD|nr:uncharacterized protein LOC124361882 isoform X3 [Homalodisca vitripennis]